MQKIIPKSLDKAFFFSIWWYRLQPRSFQLKNVFKQINAYWHSAKLTIAQLANLLSFNISVASNRFLLCFFFLSFILYFLHKPPGSEWVLVLQRRRRRKWIFFFTFFLYIEIPNSLIIMVSLNSKNLCSYLIFTAEFGLDSPQDSAIWFVKTKTGSK